MRSGIARRLPRGTTLRIYWQQGVPWVGELFTLGGLLVLGTSLAQSAPITGLRVLWIVLLFFVGLLFLSFKITGARKQLDVLRYGVSVVGSLSEEVATNFRLRGKRVVYLKFAYLAKEAPYQLSVRAREGEESVGRDYLVLYHPDFPHRATVPGLRWPALEAYLCEQEGVVVDRLD